MAFKLQRSPVQFTFNQPQRPQAPATQATGGGRGGFLSSLISEGSAAAGAGIGTAIAPGLGTILGAIIGGFGGRLTENKVRDDEFKVGSAVGEGALSGAFAGIAPAFKAVKGGVSALRGGDDLASALTAAGGAATRQPGARAAQAGQNIVGQARGITPGVGKTSVRKGLSIQGAKDLNKFVDDLGIKKGSALQQLEQVETIKTQLFNRQADILRTGNKRLSAGVIKEIRDEVSEKVAKTPGLTVTKQFSDDLSKLGRSRSTRSLNEFRKSIDDLINFNRASATPDPTTERLYRQLRRAVDKRVAGLAPELKQVNTTLNKLYDVEDLLQDASKKASSTSDLGAIGYKIPLVGNRLPGGASQAVRNKFGRGLSSPATQVAARGVSAATPQLAGRIPGLLGGAVSGQEPQNKYSTNEMTDSMATANTIPSATSNINPLDTFGGGMSSELGGAIAQAQSPYPIENAMADIQRDPENADYYMTLFEFANQGGQAEQKPLSGTQQQQSSNAMTALNDLSTIESEITRDPGVAGKAALPFDSLSNRFTGAGEFEAAKNNIVDALARLRSGAAITDFEFENFSRLLPQTFDDPQLIQSKVARLRDIFSRFANPQPTSELDLASLLATNGQ